MTTFDSHSPFFVLVLFCFSFYVEPIFLFTVVAVVVAATLVFLFPLIRDWSCQSSLCVCWLFDIKGEEEREKKKRTRLA